MSTTRPHPSRGAALVALAALAVAGCAREGGAPEPGTAAAAQAPTARRAPPSTPPATAARAGASAGTSPTAAAPAPVEGPVEAPAAPGFTLEQLQRRSPSAALVETFSAACAEPGRNAVARAAERLDFTPIATAPPREASSNGAAAATSEDGGAWRGPEEVGGAVLVWDAGTSTCELRADGVDLLLVESAFSRLSKALEEEGSSVMRLTPPPAPAAGVRTRQMLLVQPGGLSRPERARVLRLGQVVGDRGDTAPEQPGDSVTLSARGVSAPR